MQNLFKGYVPTKDKKCMMKFKNAHPDELMTYEQVRGLDEFAGILNDDVILVDIDDLEQSEILMDIVEDLQLRCRVYKTTRGKHFLFLNDELDRGKTKTKVACGLDNVDMKVGRNNSYTILKFGGKERPIIYDIFEDEDYEAIPKWLYPIRTSVDFNKLGEGDGRNQALFNHILTLQSYDFSMDDARAAIRVMNDYILQDPLDENELETILRDDAFKKPMFYKKGQFLFDVFAKYLIATHHIKRIGGQLYVYKDGIYINGERMIEAEMVRLISNLNRAKRTEVLSMIDILVNKSEEISQANYIAFKNGIYDLDSGELLEFSPDIIVTNMIPWDYKQGAYSKLADRTLDKMACHDSEIRSLLEEGIGYCFYRRNEMRKSFILTGEKRNGKSTYLGMLEHLLGWENVAALDLKELGERFKTVELVGKLANIGDDIGDEFVANPSIFKKLVSGDLITVEDKGAKGFKFANYSKLIFSANNIPRIKDKSGAVIDRLVIIPFNHQFTTDEPDYDAHIKYKLKQRDVMEYLIQIGLDGLRRVLDNQEFTHSEKVEKSILEYEENNNPILLFFKEAPKIENEPTNRVYMKYSEFCIINGFTAMSKIEFSKQVKKYLGYKIIDKSISNKKCRVFALEE